ncbi:MAG: F0F1 ATP synthase subunit B family protein [Rhizomicrobium sp.]
MAAGTTASTEVPAKPQGAGFPPFKTETFPSQIFWLVITFAFLFVVLWRVAGPRIQGVLSMRRGQIDGDIAKAQRHRADAESASAAYQAALASARARSQALAEENRKRITGEIDRAKAEADAAAQADIAKAEARIAASRGEARIHVTKAAQEAAIAIVARLTGENVPADEAATAVRAVTGN